MKRHKHFGFLRRLGDTLRSKSTSERLFRGSNILRLGPGRYYRAQAAAEMSEELQHAKK